MSDIPTIVLTQDNCLQPDPKHLELHASLTTPDAEDWVVIPGTHHRLFVCGFRERQTDRGISTIGKFGWCYEPSLFTMLRKLSEKNFWELLLFT